jgi:hypothetical protein
MLLTPFLDGGQRVLDVFFRAGIRVGVKNLCLWRNHIGNAVGEGRADKWNGERGVIGFYDRKAGVGANREFVAALFCRKVALHLDVVARNADDAGAYCFEIPDVFSKFMRLERADAGEGFGINTKPPAPFSRLPRGRM